MKLTIEDAAEAVGVSRQTVWRATKNGKLSSENDESGVRTVDTSELFRLYEPTKAYMDKLNGTVPDVATDVMGEVADATSATPRNTSSNRDLALELKFLREHMVLKETLSTERVEMLNVLIEDLRADKAAHAHERQAWTTEREGLVATVKELGTSVRLLTDQRPAPVISSPSRRAGGLFGFLRRG